MDKKTYYASPSLSNSSDPFSNFKMIFYNTSGDVEATINYDTQVKFLWNSDTYSCQMSFDPDSPDSGTYYITFYNEYPFLSS